MNNQYDIEEDSDIIIDDEVNMNSCCLKNLVIIINTRGANNMVNRDFPAHYGLYGEIRTREFTFHFNPTGEIRYMRGLSMAWPHPREWLKRSWGNDWTYYSVGLDQKLGRVRDWMGENYLPCLSYESNAILNVSPYSEPPVAAAFSAWSQVYATLCTTSMDHLPEDIRQFLKLAIQNNEDTYLMNQAERLHAIIGGRISVLPPDTRHVDYEVIPVNIADGCLYRCKFCSVKTGNRFKPRSIATVKSQIENLKTFYAENLQNLNAIFIGNHDALAASADLIRETALLAFDTFGFARVHGGTPALFLFGSADSFLKADEGVMEMLDALPYKSYINLGLEAYDEATLTQLGKPITPDKVKRALEKMIQVNTSTKNVTVSANFLLGTSLSEAHNTALIDLLSNLPDGSGKRGCIYLSPLIETLHRDKVLPMFYAIKEKCPITTYIYLIQRL